MSAQTNKFKRAAKIAKRLYKTGKYNRYSDAVKAAFKTIGSPGNGHFKGRLVKRKKATGSRKKKKAPAEHVKSIKRSVVTTSEIGTVSGHMASAKKLLGEKIAVCELHKFKATTKRVKRHYARMIADYKKAYRKLL